MSKENDDAQFKATVIVILAVMFVLALNTSLVVRDMSSRVSETCVPNSNDSDDIQQSYTLQPDIQTPDGDAQ